MIFITNFSVLTLNDMIKKLLAGLLFFIYVSSYSFAQQIFTLNDLGKITSLSEPSLSPDGETALVVLSKADFDLNKRDYVLRAINIKTGEQKILTSDRPSIGHVRWSPDGRQIAFLATSGIGKDAHFQIFLLPVNGGEARKLTNMPAGVSQFTFKPDGNEIAFVAQDEPANKAELDKGYDAFEISNNSYLMAKTPLSSHIWLVNVTDQQTKRLTSGSWSLPVSYPPGPSPSPLSWSPDGKLIAFEKVNSPYSGELVHTIQLIDVATGAIKSITGRMPGENSGLLRESNPAFSPDGQYISYRFSYNGSTGGNDIYVTAASGGKGRPVTSAIDRNLFLSEWSADGNSILVGGNDVDKASIWLQPVNGKAAKLSLGDLSPANPFGMQAMMNRNGAIVFIASTAKSAPELYYMASSKSIPKTLTNINAEVSGMKLGKSEFLTWQSDTYTCNGVITYPPEFDPSKKYPLVLIIHGGPQSATLMNFGAQAQFTASKGYVIFQPNYRGSDNMGNVFDDAINSDAGAGPGRDVMAGLTILKKRAYIDTAKIAVTGWSYGGYMTTWLIGHYPNAWKCAVAGAPVTDIVSQYSFSDYGPGRKARQGGLSPYSSEQAMSTWMKQSPISSVQYVKAPTLLLHDLNDERVALPESYTFYRGLKDNGVTAKFIVFPVAGHFPSDPVHSKEVYRYWIGWIDQYLK
jgi:dipeptidyl aminopeptidase/acylaminoacyl peptidase